MTAQYDEKTKSELSVELDAKIPREAVSTREGGGRTRLSYLETWYVIDRMNKVFGHLNWSNETLELREISGSQKPTYLARVRVSVATSNGFIFKDGVGYGSDKSGMNPHEMAAKEAESDAFKRAAKNFGLSLGLALYDKSQEHVDDGQEQPAVAAKGPKKSATETKAAPVDRPNPSSGVPETPPGARSEVNQMISEMSRVITARKTKTLAELKKYLTDTYGQDEVKKLTDDQAKTVYTYLRTILEGGTK